MSSLNSVDSGRIGQFQEDSASKLSSLENVFPPFLNVAERPNETKLNKLFKAAKLGTSVDPFHKNPERKKNRVQTEAFDSCASEDSFRGGSYSCIEEINSIIDPACGDVGVIDLLERMKIKIGKLGTVEKRFRGVAQLILVKSKLQMRRKSDASKWSGGVSRLESSTSFLVYDYVPAIAIQDTPNRKELSSPLFARERASSRQKQERDKSGSTDRKMSRIEETMIPCTTMTLISSPFSMKTFNIKDAEIFSLENEDKNGRAEGIRQLIRSSLSGHDSVSTLKVMIVKKDILKDIPENHLRNHMNTLFVNTKSSYFHDNADSRFDLGRKMSESQPFKGNTIVELKVPNKERIKLKIHSVVSFRQALHSQTEADAIPPPLERNNTLDRNFKNILALSPLSPSAIPSNLQQISQTSIFSPKNVDIPQEARFEFPKPPPKNAKAKLANILNPTECTQTQPSSSKSPQSFLSPRVTKHHHTKSLLTSFEKQKPSKFKEEKPSVAYTAKIQSQKNSPRNTTSKKMNQSELFIKETYNQTKLKISISSPKTTSKKIVVPPAVHHVKNKSIDKKGQTLPALYKRSFDLYKPSSKKIPA